MSLDQCAHKPLPLDLLPRHSSSGFPFPLLPSSPHPSHSPLPLFASMLEDRSDPPSELMSGKKLEQRQDWSFSLCFFIPTFSLSFFFFFLSLCCLSISQIQSIFILLLSFPLSHSQSTRAEERMSEEREQIGGDETQASALYSFLASLSSSCFVR